MKKLISMTDFVLLIRENRYKDNIIRFWDCEKYAQFLKQHLTLGMFVPCDENGNVLEDFCNNCGGCGYTIEIEVECCRNGNHECCGYPNPIQVQKQCLGCESERYQQSKERVIFEGFEMDFTTKRIIGISNIISQMWFYENGIITIDTVRIETIEDLVNYNLTIK